MEISFVKLSPTQNVTLLVESPVPRNRQAAVASALLAYDGPGGEQAGYIEKPKDSRARARLQMMGGEFCGNATMALGAYLARRDGLPDGASTDMLIEVSGSDAPVPCRIRREGAAFVGTVRMPLPESIGVVALDDGGGSLRVPLVRMPGIAHLIIPHEEGFSESELKALLPLWNENLRADALGAIVWDEPSAAIDPLVYVPSTGTIVREHGCGSGTAAVGSWKAVATGRNFSAAIRQPGGAITVEAAVADGRLSSLTITGSVRITAQGTAFID